MAQPITRAKRAVGIKRVVYGKFDGQRVSADVLTVQEGEHQLCSSKCRFLRREDSTRSNYCALFEANLVVRFARKTDNLERCLQCNKGER